MAMKIPTTPTKTLEHKLTALREYSEETKQFTHTTRQSLDQFKVTNNSTKPITTTTTIAPAATATATAASSITITTTADDKLTIDDLRNFDAFQNPTINVPQLLKMVTEPLNEYCKSTTAATTTAAKTTTTTIPIPRVGISRSQDDDYNIECFEEKFGSVSPIPMSGNRKGSISSIGATRAINFRQKFRKSHTCGSLFAKCNCNEIEITTTAPINYAALQAQAQTHPHALQATSNYGSLEQTTIHTPSSFHRSISPSSHTDSLSTRNTSGIYSLSTQTSSATSTQLSRDESMSASFDLSTTTPAYSTTQNSADSQLSAKRQQATNASETAVTPPNTLQVPRLSATTVSEQADISPLASSPSTTGNSTVSQKLDRKSRRLFQSYSHPDTDFIFTHENKNPSRECVASNTDNVILARGGKVEIKHPKRCSSPNIGQYQILDVAVHPDILVKISPKHSPCFEARRVHTTLSQQQQQQQQQPQHQQTPRSAQQRRRLLQRSHEIDSGSSTSESEQSFDQRQLPAALALDFSSPSKQLQQTTCLTSPHSPISIPKSFLAGTCSSPIPTSDPSSLSAAQKYFAESGVLGPISKTPTSSTPISANNLTRKTSKILQDVNVIEQIRKTSMILRASSTTNLLNKKNSATSLATAACETPATPAQRPSTQSNKYFNYNNNNNCNNSDCTDYVNMETPATIVYAPSKPNTPHPLATTCGFSPNLAAQTSTHTDDRDAQIKSLQGEIVSLKDVIKSRDAEIMKLRREIHKLKSVLQQTTNHLPIARDDLLQSTATSSASKQRYHLPQQCNEVSTTGNTNACALRQQTCSCCKRFYDTQPAIPEISSSSSTDLTICIDNNQTCSATLSAAASSMPPTVANANSNGTATVTCALAEQNIENAAANAEALAASPLACNGVKAKIINLTQTPVLKKQGVSAESCEQSMQQSFATPIPTYDKDYGAKQLIKEAIMDNDFLKNIDASQVRELVESMYPLSIAKGEFVIREGEVGAHLYVSAEGDFEVVKNEKVLGVMGPGKAFGELAILYNCTRTASIRVLCDARVWVLDRRVFQQIMMRTGMQRIENSVNFLKSVPLLKNLSVEVLAKIADVLEVEFYPAGTYIIRQGASGDTFFLISQGSVKVTQKLTPSTEEKEIRILERGDYFGEQALINEDKRTANIIAMAPGVECLTLDRDSFKHLIGDLCELKEKNYGDENRVLAMKYAESTKEVFGANLKQEFPELKLTDLEVVSTLGIGGFGRVELVKAYQQNSVDTFALKCLKKRHILDTKQEEHVFSERTIMLTCNSPFICRLHRTFRDEKYVYMLLEACMGGEIWTMLRDRGSFDENATQFIIGCVLQAFEYLHARGIIYRDLKPENLMLNERGYVKLVDFGFAKYIGNSSKTWTFCGTPEYVAPEIILNKGHDRAVDYWALGVLIHELLNGTPPFTANDPMKTYNIILKGIDMITFPKHMSRSAIQLIKRLCRDVPAERLGYQKGGIQDIKKHKWFLGFDWDGLEQQLLIPPFVRPIAHPTDTSYFDQFPCDPAEPPDELSGWDEDF